MDAHVLAEEHLGKFARQLVIIPTEYRVRDSRSLSGREGNSEGNSRLSAIAYRDSWRNISKVISWFCRESWREEKRMVVNDEAVMGKTRGGGGWGNLSGRGMTFNAHPRGVSRLFRVNDEIKLCSKSSNGGGMKSLSAPALLRQVEI